MFKTNENHQTDNRSNIENSKFQRKKMSTRNSISILNILQKKKKNNNGEIKFKNKKILSDVFWPFSGRHNLGGMDSVVDKTIFPIMEFVLT